MSFKIHETSRIINFTLFVYNVRIFISLPQKPKWNAIKKISWTLEPSGPHEIMDLTNQNLKNKDFKCLIFLIA